MFSMRNGSCSRSSLNRYNAWSISKEENTVSMSCSSLTVFLSPQTHLVCCGTPRRSGKWCRCSWQTQPPLDSDISGVPLWSSGVLCTCVPWRNLSPNSPAETKISAEKDTETIMKICLRLCAYRHDGIDDDVPFLCWWWDCTAPAMIPSAEGERVLRLRRSPPPPLANLVSEGLPHSWWEIKMHSYKSNQNFKWRKLICINVNCFSSHLKYYFFMHNTSVL